MDKKISRYKITTESVKGYMLIVYQDSHLKSVLNEFNQPLTDEQLNYLLKRLPDDPNQLIPRLHNKGDGKIKVEAVKAIGSEPEQAVSGMASNDKIAIFCEWYKAKTFVSYKVSAADSGKIATIAVNKGDWEKALQTYFNSNNFLFKNKYSISNIVKYWNELRVEAFGKPAGRSYPIPYDPEYFKNLNMMEQREYWQALRDNGYSFDSTVGRSGSWVKKNNLINQ